MVVPVMDVRVMRVGVHQRSVPVSMHMRFTRRIIRRMTVLVMLVITVGLLSAVTWLTQRDADAIAVD